MSPSHLEKCAWKAVRLLLPMVLVALLLPACSDDGGGDETTDLADQSNDVSGDGQSDMSQDQSMDLGDQTPDAEDLTPDGPDDIPDADDEDVEPVQMDTYLYVAETDGDITVYLIDDETGALTEEGVTEQGGNLQFLAFGPDNQRLYAANGASVQAFDISSDPVPTYLSEADATVGGTHLAVDHTRRHVFVASYGGNAVAMLPLDANGEPSDATVVLGGGAMPGFCQNAHQIRVHPSNQFVYVPCLGSDHVAVLDYDADAGTLAPSSTGDTADGAGPRHLDFHPGMDVAYVINELNSTIDVFSVNPGDGALSSLQTISTVPMGADPSRSSDIHVSPDGRFVYGMNREPENTLASFSVDEASGTLTTLGYTSTSGDHARTFVIHPNGEWVFVGSSNSQDLTTFSRDVETGALTQVGQPLGGFSDRVFFVGIRQVER